MSAALRGLSEGLQTGLQLGSTLRGIRQRRDLADESARYGITEGAYGEDLNRNIEQLREVQKGLDPKAAAQYEPAIAELQRRAAMTQPDYSVGSRGTYDTREAASTAAAPMRAQGLARVYERYGDIDQADTLRERAAEQLQRNEDREFLRFTRPLELESQQLNVAGQRQAFKDQEALAKARQQLATAQEGGKPPTSDDIRRVANQTGANFGTLLNEQVQALGYDATSAQARLKRLQSDFSSAAARGIPGINKFLADNFDPNGDDADTPQVTQDKNGRFVVTYGGRVLQQYGASKDALELSARILGVIQENPLEVLRTLQELELRRAQANRPSPIQQKLADFQELYGRKPTEDEKAILVGLQGRPGTDRQPTESDITARARFYLDNDRTGKLTPQEALTQARKDFGLSSGVAAPESGVDRLIRLMQERRAAEQNSDQSAGSR
jgi:hypothetical protein